MYARRWIGVLAAALLAVLAMNVMFAGAALWTLAPLTPYPLSWYGSTCVFSCFAVALPLAAVGVEILRHAFRNNGRPFLPRPPISWEDEAKMRRLEVDQMLRSQQEAQRQRKE